MRRTIEGTGTAAVWTRLVVSTVRGVAVVAALAVTTIHLTSCDEPTCKGAATACRDVGNQCHLQEGCYSDVCEGTSVACGDILLPESCESQNGCTAAFECMGERVSCNSFDNQLECDSNLCDWSAADSTCYLSSGRYYCSDYTATECPSVEGCAVGNFQCLGNVEQCTNIYVTQECAEQQGCTPDCIGTARPCDQIQSENDCAGQEGCSWY